MKWKENGRYDRAEIGHLFAYIEHLEAWSDPSDPEFQPESFSWFIAPDDEDKNYRRAIYSGDEPTRQGAELAIRSAILKLIDGLHTALNGEPV